jgi:hypothetical protein
MLPMQKPARLVAVIGLALGAALGMAGTMVAAQNLRATFWAIDGVGLIVATALLAVHWFRTHNDCVAAGFLVYAIGESVMLTGTAGTLAASIPSFAAGTALWSAGLLLVSLPRALALWTRAAGVIAGILFGITAASIFWGGTITPLSRPLPFFAYPFLVLTFIGWIVAVIQDRAPATATP